MKTTPLYCEKIFPVFPWKQIDTVLLDMDGTLLDKHFDDYFWEQYLPEHYSLLHDISVEEAKAHLLARYHQVKDTLDWSDLDFWSRELDMDVQELKLRINHLIGVHPYVVEFLEYCLKIRKRLYLITNAHSSTLSIKLQKTAIGPWFDRIVCAAEVGLAKEDPQFWQRLEEMLQFDKRRTLLVDDTEKVLFAAQSHGLGFLLFVARPSSRQRVQYSCNFPSIVYFKELLPQ
ncbi:HAD-superfamily hydrolase, subfamily IA, variant 1 [Desulfobulbus propionicus DSM 2032]|jgi:putative hydrolase of the HAD superfamily|uniref:HAD-superfamily hydrolase, subfamily IA, variant 1 n=1 Tax=Desulfobulbus propionicus (strain ATCC 33891 / DSM 2032 / VKM B-1956 / 1pr3) TaxID=577650 RepID=A0A7U3YJX8_DESPD|nr:HAD-IA family hydrolase [Desulfobulbus propionicus]ADW16754.1 HAD-superfamily hydrolase, subfamily IA, variant 1 [Desulfobulbus propionicus DSM 2032]